MRELQEDVEIDEFVLPKGCVVAVPKICFRFCRKIQNAFNKAHGRRSESDA